ncbi:MAG: cobalamin biosynthesis protein CobD [Tissierellia bacterium]|nr:cobalamin biosynthesis protein CobD [Tissierellia bacterium]
MSNSLKFVIAVILDLIFGDPYSLPHPVRAMGALINFEERIVRKFKEGDFLYRFAGLIIALFNISLAYLIPFGILHITKDYKYLNIFLEIFMMYQILAAGTLGFEAKKVYNALEKSLESARKQVSFIVGRDTDSMTEEEVIKATIETVAENAADGVIAPLFYMFLLGVPGGMMYKMVNTMDSMLGYNNDKYKNLGYFPAKIDDLFNLIPSRLAALLMLLSSLFKYDVANGWKVFKRDRYKHKSPNSCQSESATAGLLGIELGGRRVYKGVEVNSGTIGIKKRGIDRDDIKRAVLIMVRSEILFLGIYIFIRSLI